MGGNQGTLDPKLAAVLARLCEKRGALTKTQASKLPYLVDVVANHVGGKRITNASHENWRFGVVASDVWYFAKPGVDGPFQVVEQSYAEGRVLISLAAGPIGGLSSDEQVVVDFVADEFGDLDYEDLGKLTKAMNLEVTSWGSNGAAKIDEDAYARLVGRWDLVLKKIEQCDTDDPSQWEELTGSTVDDLRKSLGV